jgi:hypothetical protein
MMAWCTTELGTPLKIQKIQKNLKIGIFFKIIKIKIM